MMPRRGAARAFATLLASTALLASLSLGATASARNSPRSITQLLVDLARDHGLGRAGRQNDADVLEVRTLLDAAIRFKPDDTLAYLLRYELASLSAERDDADRLATRIVDLDPGATAFFADWLEKGSASTQTAEARRAWLESTFERELPPPSRALVYVDLARLALEQLDPDRARTARDSALAQDAWCPDATLLGLELLPPNADSATRLSALLAAFKARPLDPRFAWEIGGLLQREAFAADATRFLAHARKLNERIGMALSPEQHLLLSRNALADGDLEKAYAEAQQAIRVRGDSFEPYFYAHWFSARFLQPAFADDIKHFLSERFDKIKDPATTALGELAQAAWYYCLIDPKPERALFLARDASKRRPGDRFIRRVLGCAQALNGQSDAARQTLLPLGADDPYAAWQLARIALDIGDEPAAYAAVNALRHLPRIGRERDLLDELPLTGPSSRPAPVEDPRIKRILVDFDPAVLTFLDNPSQFIDAKIEVEDRSPAPGQPWRLVLTIANRADFPITLGPDRMLNPVALLSFDVQADRAHSFENLMTIAADRERVIRPHRSIRVRRAIDIGPLRRLSRRMPQRLLRVTVRGLLDPSRGADGVWRTATNAAALRPVSFNRLPARTEAEAWNARFAAIRGDDPAARNRALEVMAELLGENQRQRLGKLGYRPERIPADKLRAALRAALTSGPWSMRVRALDALQSAGLDRTLYAAANACLDHEHWLVRLLAVRLLSRSGKAFNPIATRLAESDPDELVRQMARVHLARHAPKDARPPDSRAASGPASPTQTSRPRP